jgi:hypothetical protein
LSYNFFVLDSRHNCIKEGSVEHVPQNLLQNKKF